jgi:hypothetical protein
MAGYDGTIRVDSQINGSGFNKGISSMMGPLVKLGAAIIAALSVTAIVAFAKAAADAASKLQILENRFRSLFGAEANNAKKQLTDLAALINRSGDSLMAIATTFQNTALGMGVVGEKASDMSVQLTTLTEDWATFYDVADSDVSGAIQSALMGMYRGLHQFGVEVDDTIIKNKALAMGIWDGYSALTNEQKALAITQVLIESNPAATGNAAKSAHTWAGEMRGLADAWENFKQAMGGAVVIFAPLLAVIHTIIDWLTVLATYFAQLVAMIFGVDVSSNAAASGVQDLSDSTGNLADNTTKAGKAAKGALASFDQINVLAQDTSEGGAAPKMPSIKPVIPTATDTGALDAIKKKVGEFYDSLVKFMQPAIDAFDRLKTALEPLGQTIWAGLQWAWDHILVPFGNWVMTEVVPHFLDLIGAAATTLNTALVTLQPLGQWLWDKFLQPLSTWVAGQIIADIDKITKALTDLGVWIQDHPDEFTAITIVLGSFAAAWVAVGVGIWIVNGALGVFEVILGVVTSPIFLVVLAIGALIAIIVLLIYFWPQISQAALDCWNSITGLWAIFCLWFKLTVLDPLVFIWTAEWFLMKTLVLTVWEDIKKTWALVCKWFQDTVIDPLKKGFKDYLDWLHDFWKSIWDGIVSFIKGDVNAIIGLINGMIRSVCGGINSIIDALNRIHIHVPSILGSAAYDFGVSIQRIGVPQIPYLATGAVIPANSQFLAVMGDQSSGRNLETPEALMRQIVREESGGKTPQNITITATGALAELVSLLKLELDRESRRQGVSLIVGGST